MDETRRAVQAGDQKALNAALVLHAKLKKLKGIEGAVLPPNPFDATLKDDLFAHLTALAASTRAQT